MRFLVLFLNYLETAGDNRKGDEAPEPPARAEGIKGKENRQNFPKFQLLSRFPFFFTTFQTAEFSPALTHSRQTNFTFTVDNEILGGKGPKPKYVFS